MKSSRVYASVRVAYFILERVSLHYPCRPEPTIYCVAKLGNSLYYILCSQAGELTINYVGRLVNSLYTMQLPWPELIVYYASSLALRLRITSCRVIRCVPRALAM